MNNRVRDVATIALVISASVALVGCTQPANTAGAKSPAPSSSASNPLVGMWRMTSLETGTEGDLKPTPYSGEVIFTSAGTMSVQAANPDTSAPDGPYTVGGYEAFYGNVTPVDNDSFTVDVTSAVARDLEGHSLARDFEISGDTLVLTPTDPSEGFRATYERQG